MSQKFPEEDQSMFDLNNNNTGEFICIYILYFLLNSHLQSKHDLEKLAEFMNIKPNQDKEICSPDETYVLTQDNLTKIMGIQMRFRCCKSLL